MAKIQTPTFADYNEFKNSVYYKRAMAGQGVEYLFYDQTPGNTDPESALPPITRGEGVSVNDSMEVFLVDEWGTRIVQEFVDGRFLISGNIRTFFIPEQMDVLPSSQDHLGRRFLILMRIAPGYAGEGIALKAWEGVALNGKDMESQNGLIRENVRFVASREYKGEELAEIGF